MDGTSSLASIQTSSILPVELNCIMLRFEQNLMQISSKLGEGEKMENYKVAISNRKKAINEIMWNEESKSWNDYNIDSNTHETKVVSISNWLPLWGRVLEDEPTEKINKVLESLEASNLIQVGGILTTNYESGQQWGKLIK